MWQNYTNAVLGLVVFVATFMGLTGATMMWTFGVLGALIIVLGLWGGIVGSPMTEGRNHEHMHA